MQKIYLVVGCPGSGKSHVCEQLTKLFDYVRHDLYIGKDPGTYLEAIKMVVSTAKRPVLIETPFSVSQIQKPLVAEGFEVIPVFIMEQPEVISARYKNREGKDIPKGHLSRQLTYKARAEELKAFQGTSDEVLNHLINLRKVV